MIISALTLGQIEPESDRKPAGPRTKYLWSCQQGKQKLCRDVATDICLNCPMAPATCNEQSLAPKQWRERWQAGQPEPMCLINVAHYYGILIIEANEIARQTISRGMSDKAYRRVCRQMMEREVFGKNENR